MQTAKNIFLFFFSFIVMGFIVILIDKMYPTSPTAQIDFQTYSKKEMMLEAEN